MNMIEEKIANARKAMREIKDYTQEQVDALMYAGAKAIYDNAVPLAELAVKETGIGNVQDKIAMHQGTPTAFYDHLKDKKSVGIIAEYPELRMIEVAHPVGVVAGITPSTAPAVVTLGNFMHAVKGKNAVVICPAPRAKKTTVDTVNLIRDAVIKCGAPKDLIQVIEEPSIALSAELMKAADLVLATGGASMVKAAYSSGTPAYGVGPGNAPAIIDRGYDLKHAAELTMIAVASDNGVLCDSDNILFYPEEEEAALFDALREAGTAIYTSKADIGKFRDTLFEGDRQIATTVGIEAVDLAKIAGFKVPANTKVIGLKVDAVGTADILNHEILAPVVTLKSYDTFENAVAMAIQNMEEQGGMGHSAGIFSDNLEHVKYYSERVPVSRVLVNQPTPDAWGPVTNALTPAIMEGCGTWGNNILAGNVDYIHLLNVSKVTWPLDAEEPDGEKMFNQ